MAKSNFENINELLKVLLWPLVVILIVVMFKADIRTMFQKSSKVSLGSFSMEIQREAQNQGDTGLSGIITSLSMPGIKKLMSMSAGGGYGIISLREPFDGMEGGFSLPADLTAWEELEKNGLLTGGTFKVSELVAQFKKLGATETRVFYNDQGVSTVESSDECPNEGKEYFLKDSQLKAEDKAQLRSYTVLLTDKGKKALNIIVETTARQIKQ